MSMAVLLLSMRFFLLTCFAFNILFSSASKISYRDHCASIVPESNPQRRTINRFPLVPGQTTYYTGGGRLFGVNPYWQKNSFHVGSRSLRTTDVAGLFKVEGFISIRRTSSYYHEGNFSYGGPSYYSPHRSYDGLSATINLDGFWSESTGKLCMVGSGMGYSKANETYNLEVVFKLNSVFNSSNISSLISGSLESLSSEKEESYFKPVSVLVLPLINYEFSLDSKEAKKEFGSDGVAKRGLPKAKSKFFFCSFDVSRAIRKLDLEYSGDCNSPQNCTPFSGIFRRLPPFISLSMIECTFTKKKQLRVLINFNNNIYDDFNTQAFNPRTTLVGEGWWDENKNQLCVVACHFLGLASSSFSNAHVGDCSVRLRLTFPSIWSIKDTSTIVGQVWNNKSVKDPGYFKGITFRREDDQKVGVQGLKYEYTQLDKVKNVCPGQNTVKNTGRRYPNPYSINMKFDMSVGDSHRKVAWGYSTPISVGDQFYNLGFIAVSVASRPSSSISVPTKNSISSGLFNICYKMSMSLQDNSNLRDSNSLFYKSYEVVKISAEGVYDAGTGNLCMVGCRNLPSPKKWIPMAHVVDCEILVKFQFPPLHTSHEGYIVGSIESTRKKSDPLYFRRLDLNSAAYYKELAKETVQRKDMEIIMVLISTTLACVLVGFQLYHVKKNPQVLPFISLIMLLILTMNHMIPLVLNFEALFTKNRNAKSFVLSDVAWLESNEITVRIITMVAFLMQFRLLQLTWSARNSTEGTQKGLWVAEKEAVYVTIPLYAAGFLVTMMVKWNKNSNEDWVTISTKYQQASSCEVMKSSGGLVLDGFLLPQIMMNMFSNMRENALSIPFYFGTSFLRLLPHAYDLYRTSNYVRQYDGSYFYADPSADLYSTAWDIAISMGGLLFAAIIYLQQRFGGSCILPSRFKGSEIYEKVPVVTEAAEEEDEETPNI